MYIFLPMVYFTTFFSAVSPSSKPGSKDKMGLERHLGDRARKMVKVSRV